MSRFFTSVCTTPLDTIVPCTAADDLDTASAVFAIDSANLSIDDKISSLVALVLGLVAAGCRGVLDFAAFDFGVVEPDAK